MARKTVQEYFSTLESRIGYNLLLGGSRHFGYYESTWWAFPIGKALRAMEDKLFTQLDLKKGATVLDAGAGFGHVATDMAKKGLFVKGVDIVDWHIAQARQHIRSQHVEDLVEIFDMSYEDTEFEAASFDGAYTMETLTHANDADLALSEFFRVLKPGGDLVLHEYEHGEYWPHDLSLRRACRHPVLVHPAVWATALLRQCCVCGGILAISSKDQQIC